MSITGDGGGTTLPSYDPWAGDPEELDAFVAKLVAREGHTTEIRIGIVSLMGDPALTNWLGKSADAFRHTLEPLPNLLEQMAGAYEQAAAGVRTYAHVLRDGQAAFAKVQSSLQSEILTNPANADGRGGAAALLASQADQASSDHDRAKRACVKELASADDHLRLVKGALADQRFADFNATFTGFHGDLGDLAGLQYLGMDLVVGQLDAVTAALNGTGGALTPDQFRAEIQDMINQYGDNPSFWLNFGPLLSRIPGYFNQHDKLPDGSLPPEDQALLTQIGQATAKAAAAGNLNFLIANTSGANLVGLAQIVAAAGGGQAFGSGPGAQFLADLVTKLTDVATNSPADASSADYSNAVSQALAASAQDGDAVRLALSGPGGQQLVTQLLQGSVSLKELVGTLGGSYTEEVPPKFPDAAAIAAFLNAGLMTSRGTDSVAMQQIQAAFNVIRVAAAFSSWNPSTNNASIDVGGLPPSITQALIHYAANNSLDLALSVGHANDGLAQVTSGPGAPFYNFTLADGEVSAFLNLALKNPDDAAAYRGYLQGAYSGAVKTAIQSPQSDWTLPYAHLLTTTQLLIDQQHLDVAQKADAASTSHLMVFNMITGALGNAPGGNLIGMAQSVDGFVQPLAGAPSTTDGGLLSHLFDTSHTTNAQQANHQDDVSQVDYMKQLVAQGALDSGRLKPDMLDPGVVVNGTVVNSPQFQTWFETKGANLVLSPPDSYLPNRPNNALSLEDYVDRLANSLELNK